MDGRAGDLSLTVWLATIWGTAVYRSLTCHWQQHWLVRRRRGDFTWTLPAACCAVLVWPLFFFFFVPISFGCLFYKTLSAKSNTWIQVQCAPPPPIKSQCKSSFSVWFLIILVKCNLQNLIYTSGWTPETFLWLTSFSPNRKILLHHLKIASPLNIHIPTEFLCQHGKNRASP